MYLVLLTYKKPLEVIDAYLPEHAAFLENNYREGRFIFSGRREPRTGGVILVNLDDEREVLDILREDPFHQHGLADYSLIAFTPTKFDERFSCFVR